MFFEIPFKVLISGFSVILFGSLTIIFLHLLKRKTKVLPSLVLSLGLAFLSIFLVYHLSFGSWYGHAKTVYIELLQTKKAIWAVLTVGVLTPPLIGSASMVSEKLSRRDFRSFYHMVYGIIIVSLLWLNHGLAFFALSVSISLFVSGEYLRRLEDGNILTRTIGGSMDGAMDGEEVRGLSSSLFYILGAMIVVIFLDTQVATASILVLAIGDTSISRVGEKLGQHKFSFNPDKTLESSLVMFLICFITLQLIGISIVTSIFAAFSASLFESLDVEISDNLLLPIITGMIILAI